MDGYDYVYAVHNDKGHIHAHIIFNSVSYLVSKKFGSLKKPANPCRFQTPPVVPELFVLCVIPAVLLKVEKNVFADSTLLPLPTPCL